MDQVIVFVINPGSTSTEIALFNREERLWQETIHHPAETLPGEISEQLDIRRAAVESHMNRMPDNALAAIVGRGGLLKPLPGGTYAINEAMLVDLTTGRYGHHASNLGAPLAREMSDCYKVPAFIVDPVTTDEFEPVARISGVPEIERRCRSHALNIKAVARLVASEQLDEDLADTSFVVAHMGGGVSVAALSGGRIIDVNDALLGMGPFSPERAGALPLEGLLHLAYGGEHTFESLKRKLSRESGLKGYLGTNDLERVFQLIDRGDHQAHLVYDAMVYQIAKEIGAMATVLKGQVEGVILTGGMAYAQRICDDLKDKIRVIAPVYVLSGSCEMEALAAGAFRVLEGKEDIREYA